MSDLFSNKELGLLASPSLMKTDEELLLGSTDSQQSVLSEEELKSAEAAASQFGIGQPSELEKEEILNIIAPQGRAAFEKKAREASYAIPLAGGFLQQMAESDITAEIAAEDEAAREKELQKKYGSSGEGFVRMDPELGLVWEKRDPETGEVKIYPQSEEGQYTQELKQRIEDTQEKTSGFLSPYALFQSEETARVPEGTIDVVGGAYGTGQGALAALSFDPSPLSYLADLGSAGLYKLEGDDEAAADVLRWTLYGAGAGAAIVGAMKARRVMQARQGMIDQFVDAGRNAEEAADMADDLLIEAQRVQRAMDQQRASATQAPSVGAAEEAIEEASEEVAEQIETAFYVSQSGEWSSGLLEASSTMPKKVGIDQFLRSTGEEYDPITKTMQQKSFAGSLTSAMGVSPAEIRATGLWEHLQELKIDGRTSVTREEILNYLDKNRVDFKTIRKGAPEGSDPKFVSLQDESWDSFSELTNPIEEYRKKYYPDANQNSFRDQIQGDPDSQSFLNLVSFKYGEHRSHLEGGWFAIFSGRGDFEVRDNRFLTNSGIQYSGESAINDRMRRFFIGDTPESKLRRSEYDPFNVSNAGITLDPGSQVWSTRGAEGHWFSTQYGKEFAEAIEEGTLIDDVYAAKTHYDKLYSDRGLKPLPSRRNIRSVPYPKLRNWLIRNDPEIRELHVASQAAEGRKPGELTQQRAQLNRVVSEKVEDIVDHYAKENARVRTIDLSQERRYDTPGKRVQESIFALTENVLDRSGRKAAIAETKELQRVVPWNEEQIRFGKGNVPSTEMMDVEFDELRMMANELGVERAIRQKKETYDKLYDYVLEKRDALQLTNSDQWKRWQKATVEFDDYSKSLNIQRPVYGSTTLEQGAGDGYQEALIQWQSPSFKILEDPYITPNGIDEDFMKSRFDTPDAFEDATLDERWEKAREYFVEKYGENTAPPIDVYRYSQDVYRDWYNAHKNNLYTSSTGNHRQSSHHSEPNIMAHLRWTDQYTIGPDGKQKKIMLVEESQSDLHQRARKPGNNGYLPTPQEEERLRRVFNKAEAFSAHQKDLLLKAIERKGVKIPPDARRPGRLKGNFSFTESNNILHYPQELEALSYADREEVLNVAKQYLDSSVLADKSWEDFDRVMGLRHGSGDNKPVIPDAPFKKTGEWAAVTVKEATRIAARDGYDGIAFIGGEMGHYTSYMPKESSRIHYGSNIPNAFRKTMGRKLAPMELQKKNGTPMSEHLDSLGLHSSAVALEQTDESGKLVNQFNGILFDDELRASMNKPQRFVSKDVEPPKQIVQKTPKPKKKRLDMKDTEEAARQWKEKGTSSPWFKRWFKDSKARDKSGKPIVVYHGTANKFKAFDMDRAGSHGNYLGKGAYFSTDATRAKTWSTYDTYGQEVPDTTILTGYLYIKKPYEWPAGRSGDSGTLRGVMDGDAKLPDDIANDVWAKLGMEPDSTYAQLEAKIGADDTLRDSWDAEYVLYDAVNSVLKDKGYDGVRRLDPKDGSIEWVVFEPTQFKSIDNRGTFDPKNAEFLYGVLPAAAVLKATGREED